MNLSGFIFTFIPSQTTQMLWLYKAVALLLQMHSSLLILSFYITDLNILCVCVCEWVNMVCLCVLCFGRVNEAPNTMTRKGILNCRFRNMHKSLNTEHVILLKAPNKWLHATYLCPSVRLRLKMGKTVVPVGRKRLTSSGSGSADVTILQVPQVMSRNYVRVPAHLRQKPPKKLAPAASTPFKVRRSNRCPKRIAESAFVKVWAIFPAVQEYARGGKKEKKKERDQGANFQTVRANFSGRVRISAAGGRRLCPVTGRSSKSEGRGNGQLGSADFGIRLGAPGRNRIDNRHHPAAVEDVGLRRGQHHHRGGHVRGAVDVLRLPEHRADPV